MSDDRRYLTPSQVAQAIKTNVMGLTEGTTYLSELGYEPHDIKVFLMVSDVDLRQTEMELAGDDNGE